MLHTILTSERPQHVVVHENATELSNGTVTGGTVSHIGQFFFDQTLINDVEATTPYTLNTQPTTPNALDRVFGEQETQGSTSDPVFDYVYVGDGLSDGLFGWIVVGINASAEYSESRFPPEVPPDVRASGLPLRRNLIFPYDFLESSRH